MGTASRTAAQAGVPAAHREVEASGALRERVPPSPADVRIVTEVATAFERRLDQLGERLPGLSAGSQRREFDRFQIQHLEVAG